MFRKFSIIVIMVLGLAIGGFSAEPVTTAQPSQGPESAVLALIPADHTLFFHAHVPEMARNTNWAGVIDPILEYLNTQLKRDENGRLAEILGFSAKNLASLYLAADISSSQRKGEEVIVVFGFTSEVDLESIMTLRRQRAGSRTKAFQTEMINGRIVFVDETNDLSIMQTSPKLIVVSLRPTIKRITKLTKKESLGSNMTFMRLLKENGASYSFAGAMVNVSGADLPFESVRFVQPSSSAENDGHVLVAIHDKHPRRATALASVIQERLSITPTNPKIKQKGSTLLITLKPSRKTIDDIFKAFASKDLFAPVEPSSENMPKDEAKKAIPNQRGPNGN